MTFEIAAARAALVLLAKTGHMNISLHLQASHFGTVALFAAASSLMQQASLSIAPESDFEVD
ncbi:hypothetical protein [Paraburkholderia sp. 40]|uniref:hypothetical protein n=1 Tax=Paraburkholderia sp. 40 TaxID=2991059 RepID=UPI003D2099D9